VRLELIEHADVGSEVWREFVRPSRRAHLIAQHAYLTSRLYETAIPLDQPWILEDIASNRCVVVSGFR